MALTNLVPISRKEKFLDKIAGESVSISPITRLERFLDAIAKGKAGDTPGAPAPITRKEYFLKKIADSFVGSIGAPVYHDDITITGSSTTAQTIKTLALDPPSSAPYAALVVCKAVDPTPGQYLLSVQYSFVTTLASNTSPLPKGGAGSDGTTNGGNTTGIYLFSSSITGAPDNPKHNITIQCKKGSGSILQNIDGDYTLDIYFITL